MPLERGKGVVLSQRKAIEKALLTLFGQPVISPPGYVITNPR
jgi:hypothetical protein